MKMRTLKQILFSVCCILFIGCHNVDTADNMLDSELLQEVRKIREEIRHDLQDDFVKKRISSIESTSTMVDIRINNFDTIVTICLFDTDAPCNKRIGDFDYEDCMTVNDGSNKIFISDISNLGILYKKQSLSKNGKEKVNFTDGISRYYYYRNGCLMPIPFPEPSDDVVVIDI